MVKSDSIQSDLDPYADAAYENVNPEAAKRREAFERARVLTNDEIISDAEPEAIVEGLIYGASLHSINGASKAGKTWYSLQLAASIAEGTEFLGRSVRRRSVLFFSLEMTAAVMHRRTRLMSESLPVCPPEWGKGVFLVAPTRGRSASLDLRSELGFEILRKRIVETGARVVLIDMVDRVMPGLSPNNPEEIGPIYDHLSDFCKEEGVAIILIDAVTKANYEGPSSLSGLGSVKKGHACNVIITLKKTNADDGGRWSMTVDSHYGEPVEEYYRRPERGGFPGYGCIPCSSTEAHHISEDEVRRVFHELGETNTDGLKIFRSRRKLEEAIGEAKKCQHSRSNQQAIVNAILKDLAFRDDEVSAHVSRPIRISKGAGTHGGDLLTWVGP